jgi:nucleoside-diphosphate-sugar epimerase
MKEDRNPSNNKLLIIGGTGFIGRNLTINAVKLGYQTHVLSLHEPSTEKKINGADYIQADITDFLNLQLKLHNTNYDYVVNLSGYIDHCKYRDGGQKVIAAHFDGVQNLLRVLDWDNLKRFIQIGSSDEYGNLPAPQDEEMCESPISPYSFGKVASSQLLQMLSRTEGFPAVILRLFLVYGPGQDNKRFLPQIIQGCLSGKSFPTSSGEQLRDICYIDDITRGILMALINENVNGEVINLASGNPIAIREVIELVKNIVVQGNPLFGKIPYRTGENMALYANVTKAKNILNWESEVDVNNGLLKTINYYTNLGSV